jgi:hypothetical protein
LLLKLTEPEANKPVEGYAPNNELPPNKEPGNVTPVLLNRFYEPANDPNKLFLFSVFCSGLDSSVAF